jgi:hypothetical protein
VSSVCPAHLMHEGHVGKNQTKSALLVPYAKDHVGINQTKSHLVHKGPRRKRPNQISPGAQRTKNEKTKPNLTKDHVGKKPNHTGMCSYSTTRTTWKNPKQITPIVFRIRDVLSRIRISTFSYCGSNMRSGMKTYFFFCFLWFQDKSLCLSQSQTDPESGKKFIPDPGSKKAPDHGYATLLTKYTKDHVEKKHTKS